MTTISDYILDSALSTLDTEANRLDVCSQEPTTFAEATSTYTLGNKTSLSVGAAGSRTPGGRKVTVAAITDGTITGNGTITHWAITDTVNSRLLATGTLRTSQAVETGDSFTMNAFNAGFVVVSEGAPIIDLNGSNSGIDAGGTFTEGDAFTSYLSSATLTDADSDPLVSLIMTCGGSWGADGPDELIKFDTWTTDSDTDKTENLVVGSTTFRLAFVASTGVLTVTNSADESFSAADGQSLIRLFQYANSAEPPTEGDRTFTWVASDTPVPVPESDIFRVRRSTDSAEADYTLTEVDDGTLDTFVGAGDGCVATWYDDSGNDNDVTQSTTTLQPKVAVSGVVQEGVVFDGSNDVMVFATRMTTGAMAALSAACWVKTTDTSATFVGEYYGGTSQRCWAMGVDASGKLQVRISADGGATNFKNYSGNTTINGGSWHHVAFTFNAGTLVLYVNGVSQTLTKTTDGTVATIYNSTAQFRIGDNDNGSLSIFAGALSGIHVEQAALSAGNIATLAAGGEVGSPLLWLKGNYAP